MTSSVDFESQRHRLTLLAYRMCGSWTDAEDTVQTVAIEWLRAADDVANPAGWLTQVTVLRSIDALRARQREAAYVGPWLPEPLVTAIDTDPLGELERSEALSTAFLVLAESLTPPQRAVVVLRALGYEYAEIAEILGITAATCRQHHVRGLRRLDRVNRRDVEHDPGISNISGDGMSTQAAELLAAFLTATRDGELEALAELLHRDVEAHQDSGGHTRAARRVLFGVAKVARFAVGVAALHEDRAVTFIQVNGTPGAIVTLTGANHVLSIQVRDGRIYRLFDACNPDKLRLSHCLRKPEGA